MRLIVVIASGRVIGYVMDAHAHGLATGNHERRHNWKWDEMAMLCDLTAHVGRAVQLHACVESTIIMIAGCHSRMQCQAALV
jgi:hypothetical protein